MKVIIAHPSAQHSYKTAHALQEGGYLLCFLTQGYYKRDSYISKFINLLPKSLKSKIHQKVERRYYDKLDDKYIINLSYLNTIILYLLKYISGNIREKYLFSSQKRFAHKVASIVLEKNPDVFIGYDTSSLKVFREIKAHNKTIKCILDVSNPHVQAYKTLEKESLVNPKWASTMIFPQDYHVIIDCLFEEVIADKIIVASEFSKNCIIKDGINADKVTKIPYGINHNKNFVPKEKTYEDKTLTFLFVGQVGQIKGLSYLLDAFKQLNNINVELKIAGPFVHTDFYVNEYSSENVTFLGRVYAEELNSLYESSDIFIFPSLFDGFGLVLLEAMSYALPCIASTHSGGPDIIDHEDSGYIIEPFSSEAIIESVKYFDNNRDKIDQMSKEVYRKSLEYTWDNYNTKLINFLDNV